MRSQLAVSAVYMHSNQGVDQLDDVGFTAWSWVSHDLVGLSCGTTAYPQKGTHIRLFCMLPIQRMAQQMFVSKHKGQTHMAELVLLLVNEGASCSYNTFTSCMMRVLQCANFTTEKVCTMLCTLNRYIYAQPAATAQSGH